MDIRNYFNNIILVFLILVVASACSDSNAPAQNSTPSPSITDSTKATIAVVAHSDFIPDRAQTIQGNVTGLPDKLADRIIEHLTNSKRFIPVERSALRKIILEQRFGQEISASYLDRTLDKAIGAMESVDGGSVKIASDGSTPAGRILEGSGNVGTTGAIADYNDILKDFKDLGSAIGADYLVLGNIEKLDSTSQKTAVPFSTQGKTVQKNTVDALLRLRVIDVKSGTVAGATSFRTKVEETLFEGKQSSMSEDSLYDQLGQLAASKILDVTFPARIVSVDPLVLSRGINDGASEGDIYIIEREGKEIRDDSGLVIARLKSKIGKVEVVKTQETVSVVRPLEGNGFTKGDLASLDVQAKGVKSKLLTSAVVPLIRGANKSRLPRIAVGLVKSASTADTGKNANKHTPVFTDSIISRLSQTKRFQVIDRQEVDQLLQEQNAQSIVNLKDMASAMGTLKGADYLLYGSLDSSSFAPKKVQLPNSSRSFDILAVSGNMRIVDARSGDILESRKVAIEKVITSSSSQTLTILADAYAEQVVLMLMNAVYPIKVAAIGQDGTVYINRGNDGGLSAGETLDAFRPGQPIIDPDTGVQLGVEETPIGQITVREVEDARSKGATADGSKVARGDILKRTAANRGKRAGEVTRNTVVRTGGTISGGVQKGGKYTLAVGVLKINPSITPGHLAKGYNKIITDDLIMKLTNTNRFVVMDRQEVDQILDAKAFEAVASGGGIEARLSELVGADYLIHGEMLNFEIKQQSKKVPYLDEIQVTTTAIAEGMFRIVDVHTGAVTAGVRVRINEKLGQVKDITQASHDLLDNFTTKSVGLIVARLFPIKVLGLASDGIVYLNRGADAGLKNGASFDVMREGQELKDPDTGLSFGRAETKVASVKIIAVESNRSRAQIISGEAAQAGDILRKSQRVQKKQKRKVSRPAW